MKQIKELIGRHEGSVVTVICGGESAIKSLPKAGADVYISANDHGVLIRPCDYICMMDRWRVDYMQSFNTPIITQHTFGDYLIHSSGFPFINTGVMCVWVAKIMGASLVQVVGMDFYKTRYHSVERGFRESNASPEYEVKMRKALSNAAQGCNVVFIGRPLNIHNNLPDYKCG